MYRLLGAQDLHTDRMPAAGQPILRTLGYTMHSGGHGIRPEDRDIVLRLLRMHPRPE